MMNIGLHCRLVGRPGRAAALKRFIDYVKGARQGLAGAPHRHRPPLAGDASLPAGRRSGPRAWTRDDFVAQFGGIFEHSPWIAERAYRARARPRARQRRRPAQCALPRSSARRARSERLGVLNAHPDLAGKLAAAKRLTPESAKRAGLRRARRADRRGARAVLQAQRRLCHDLRLSLHHRGEGQDQGGDPGGLRNAHRQRPRHRVRHRLQAGRAHRAASPERHAACLRGTCNMAGRNILRTAWRPAAADATCSPAARSSPRPMPSSRTA